MKSSLLKKCLEIARDNNTPIKHPQWGCYHHFSFIIQEGKIIDWGTNRKASPLTFLGYLPHAKIHSETDAYFKAKGIMIKGASFEIVNIRLNKMSKIMNSEPCKCCFTFLNNMGCKKAWFTTKIGNFACIIFRT